MSESDKSGKPELTVEDTKRIEDKSHMTYPNDSIWRGFDVSIGFRSAFRIGAEYATLHERSAAQARIAELEAALKLTWLALRAGDTDEQIKAIEQAKPYIK